MINIKYENKLSAFNMKGCSVHSHLHVGIWGHVVMSVVIRCHAHQHVVLLDLPRKLEQDLSGQINAVVFMFSKLYELDKISLGLVALVVSHLAVIVVQLMHEPPVSISDAHNDHTQR